ncbi:MAG TPA: potassium-transporting ATPase subunit KdpA, partial [Algoriphagus sp.]|nr:potassium-transporting ATPase subunit KdpA [Algoriphagus sp.]
MTTELLGIILIFLASLALAWPLGKYMVRVFTDQQTFLDFLNPIEEKFLRFAEINPSYSMDWKQNAKALLGLNLVFFFFAFLFLLIQNSHPFWNPVQLGNWEPTLAFNTAVSFVTNTNLQHYSGETGASYFTQLMVFGWLQFVSAGTGIAACALIFQGLKNDKTSQLGNFYKLFLRSCTRILLPLAILVSLILVIGGTPVTFEGLQEVTTLEGEKVNVATGPVAPMVAIKQLGTNGGGFFGPNSTHPLENPSYLTNVVENISILLIPMALVFGFGFYLDRKKLAVLFMSVMTFLFLTFVVISIVQEQQGNPLLRELGLAQSPNLEGKELRFGSMASSFWGVSTTSTSNGSVNSMHDSHSPLSGGIFMLDMMINAIYGGVGVGFINFFVYVIVAVFIAGQMIGRTPDFLGKKIEAPEIKLASLVILLHPFLILAGTALSAYSLSLDPELGWLNNPSYHGFSEILYENTSAAANNGSGFEGLSDNTPFWNLLTGIIMLLGRFLPIIGPLALIGSLSFKKSIPQSSGSLRPESLAFGVV